ncbi:MAG: sensor histidine kinase [Sulfuricurvum sp.]|uniref:sensor histidine kinase n=1 Tax=Sulfuricurvum sp. TaxID=2025608 RepID=UPI00262FEED2|nr:sensor histidine kinase [Sulfuricurvum sp.]MDD2367922.1 sensor histidine kinase [Sulfuricurvum sp.]MDD5119669.1 sensor histidine kinase [Sulfuricurvum sp.]
MEITIRRIALVLLLVLQTLYGYDTIEVLNKNITLSHSGYAITKNNLSAAQAYTLYNANGFKELPKSAKSFGFDTKSYWYAFSISMDEKPTERYYLDVRTPTLNQYELYAFANNPLITHGAVNSFIPDLKQLLEGSSGRFGLLDTNGTVTYLLKIDTKAPRLSAFAFGTYSEIEEIWHTQSFIFAFATGITLFVAFFTLIFYLNTKDKIYLFYLLYIAGLYGAVLITSGHAKPLIRLFPAVGPFLVGIFLQIQLIGLTYFSERLLDTHTKLTKMGRFIQILLYLNITLFFAFPIGPLFKTASFLMSVSLFTALIYAAYKMLTRESKIPLYYLIATGSALLLMVSYTLMHQGILPYGVVSSNFLTLALIWDMTFLSLALGDRIALMQRENIEKERILTLKSRQETLGELTGNVAHQWRSPLSKIGVIVSAIQAKLIYSEISKKEILDYLSRVSAILKHLSSTVETFQSFLVSNDKQEYFDLSQSLEEMFRWIEPTFHTENIKLLYTFEPECRIRGEKNEILQAILAIIQNSKEALTQSYLRNGHISLTLSKSSDSVILTIQDNGGGIKLIPISKVFDPYVSTKQNGTGIGLALARTIIEKRHNGKLSVRNEDQGAVFAIELQQV